MECRDRNQLSPYIKFEDSETEPEDSDTYTYLRLIVQEEPFRGNNEYGYEIVNLIDGYYDEVYDGKEFDTIEELLEKVDNLRKMVKEENRKIIPR